MSEHVTSGTVRDRSDVEALRVRRSSRKDGASLGGGKKADTVGLGYLTYEARDEGFPFRTKICCVPVLFVCAACFLPLSKTHITTSCSVIIL